MTKPAKTVPMIPGFASEIARRSPWGSSRRLLDGWTERCLVSPVGPPPSSRRIPSKRVGSASG